MSRLDKAREFRNRINANLQATRKLIRVDELEPEELENMIDLYPQFEIGKNYLVDDIFKYEDKLYFEGIVRESTMNGNVWSPTEYPDAWKIPDD